MKKTTAFWVVTLIISALNYLVWHMLVISKYGYNPLTVFPVLVYIFVVLVGMGVIE